MNKTKSKTALLLPFLSAIILTGLGWVYARATTSLEVVYPVLPHAPDPSLLMFLPDYIRYIYVLVIISGGLIALVALIYGGLRYLTSAGNPSKMADSRNQILSALIGLVVILGSYVFLTEINPDLVVLEPPGIIAAGQGIIAYTDNDCGGGSNSLPDIIKALPPGTRFLRVESVSILGTSPGFDVPFNIGSFFTFNSSEDITIEIFSSSDCRGGFLRRLADDDLPTFAAGACVDSGALKSAVNGARCIRIIWHKPGIYLYSFSGGDPEKMVPDGECFKIFTNSVDFLPECLKNNVQSMALMDNVEAEIKFGAILRDLDGGRRGPRGWAHVYLPNRGKETTLHDTENINANSLTLFRVNPGARDAPMTVCRNVDCLPTFETPASITFEWDGKWERIEQEGTAPTTGSDGLSAAHLSTFLTNFPDIARGVRIAGRPHRHGIFGDFDGRWACATLWPRSRPHWLRVHDGACAWHAFLVPDHEIVHEGISAISFGPGAQYLAILYDRADAVTNSTWQSDGILHPNGNALITRAPLSDLLGVRYDNCTGSVLLIKIK